MRDRREFTLVSIDTIKVHGQRSHKDKEREPIDVSLFNGQVKLSTKYLHLCS